MRDMASQTWLSVTKSGHAAPYKARDQICGRDARFWRGPHVAAQLYLVDTG